MTPYVCNMNVCKIRILKIGTYFIWHLFTILIKTQEYLLGNLSITADDQTTLSDESQKNVEILNSDRIIGGMLYYKIIFI